MNKWLIIFLTAYLSYLIISIDEFIDLNQSSNAMTSLLVKRLINVKPSSVESLLVYLKTSKAHYPIINLGYGLTYPLINSLIKSVWLMKLLNAVLSVINLLLLYSLLRNNFNETTSTLTILLTATSRVFIKQSISIMPQVMALLLLLLGYYFYLKRKNSLLNSLISGLLFGLSALTDLLMIAPIITLLIMTFKNNFKNNLQVFILFLIIMTPLVIIHEIDFFNHRVQVSYYYLIPITSLLISYITIKLYDDYGMKIKILTLFLLVLIIIIQLPLINDVKTINLSGVTNDLINDCPNCTILLVSKQYTGLFMYESLIKDENQTLKFILPVGNLITQVKSEKVNRVLVIGETGLSEVNQGLLNNRYELIKEYDLNNKIILLYIV